MEHTRRDILKLGTMFGVSYMFGGCGMAAKEIQPELILRHARIATLDGSRSVAQAVAIQDGRFLAAGSDDEVMRLRGAKTQIIDVGGRTVIPGLNDCLTSWLSPSQRRDLYSYWSNSALKSSARMRL
jgi:cytosine/adenosine deaminase-related metal-dependent hydrolase